MLGFPVHALIVHFPVALAIMAAFYDVRGALGRRPDLHAVGYGLSLWAALTAVMAVASGLGSIGTLGLSASAPAGHAAAGIASGLVLVAFGLFRYSVEVRREDPIEAYPLVWLVLEVSGALLVLATAVLGHRMVD